jgi:thymidylate kinase
MKKHAKLCPVSSICFAGCVKGDDCGECEGCIPLSESKPKFVIFEGCDKVGKSTLFKLYRSATHYGPLAIDRFTGSNWVYDSIYHRENNLNAYLESETFIQSIYDCYLILLSAPTEVIKERIEKNEIGDDKTIALKNFERADKLFQDYFMNHSKYHRKLMMDTSMHTPDECLDIILGFTREGGKS